MISEEYLSEKLNSLAHWKQIKIMKGSIKHVLPDLQKFEPQDLDKAIKWLVGTDDRFDMHKLLDSMIEFRTNRLQEEESTTLFKIGQSAQDLSYTPRYTADCTRETCRGCPHVENCIHRAREWFKGNEAINRGSLGKKGAEELIHYMKHDFMGGTDFDYDAQPNPK